MTCTFRYVAAIMAICFGSAAAQAADPQNILWFGNSFSYRGGDVPENVERIAQADGHLRPNIVQDLQGGKDFDYHLGQISLDPAGNLLAIPSGKTYDVVVMQGHSTESTHKDHPDYVTEFPADALALYQGVTQHASGRGAGARPVLYQTWARQAGHSYYPGSFANPEAMQAEIIASYERARLAIDAATSDGFTLVAPVGEGFQSTNFDASLYDTDRYHANTKGALLASLIIYRTIYDEDVTDIPYASVSGFARVDQATWDELIQTADGVPIPEPGTAVLIFALAPLTLRRPHTRGR